MSIKARVTQSALAATLIMAFCFYVIEAGATDWSEDSKGYTLNCDIADLVAVFGQWKTFKAKFSLPADARAKLWYECKEGGEKSTMRDPSYDFDCEVKVAQSGASFYISHVGHDLHIRDLVPGYITFAFACKKVAKAANVEVRKNGR